jgi:hypothetical protein
LNAESCSTVNPGKVVVASRSSTLLWYSSCTVLKGSGLGNTSMAELISGNYRPFAYSLSLQF